MHTNNTMIEPAQLTRPESARPGPGSIASAWEHATARYFVLRFWFAGGPLPSPYLLQHAAAEA